MHVCTLEEIAYLGHPLNFIEYYSGFGRKVDVEMKIVVRRCVQHSTAIWEGMLLVLRAVTRSDLTENFSSIFEELAIEMSEPVTSLFLDFVSDTIHAMWG